MISIEPHDFLTRVYRTAVAAADPRRATRQAVAALTDLAPTVWLFAIGKGAHAMASGAVESLRTQGRRIAGGLVVAHVPTSRRPTAWMRSSVITGALRSSRWPHLPADAVARNHADDDAIVLSGGATSRSRRRLGSSCPSCRRCSPCCRFRKARA
jgi:glycerate-2-kinase